MVTVNSLIHSLYFWVNLFSLETVCSCVWLTQQDPQMICHVCCFVCLQAVRLSDHRGRLCFSGLSSELQPLPSERAGPELQSSRRLRSEAAVCSIWGSTLETGHSQVYGDISLTKSASANEIHACWYRGAAHIYYFCERFHSTRTQNISAHAENIVASEEKNMLSEAEMFWHLAPRPKPVQSVCVLQICKRPFSKIERIELTNFSHCGHLPVFWLIYARLFCRKLLLKKSEQIKCYSSVYPETFVKNMLL